MEKENLVQSKSKKSWILIGIVILLIIFLGVYYVFFKKPVSNEPIPITREEKLKMMEEASKDIVPSPLTREEKLKLMQETTN